jgi:type IX secretion system PorP/SprF family membrane protein
VKKKGLLILCLCLWELSWAQDANFTQFYATPLYVNPALTGTTPEFRLETLYRNQWSLVPNAYQSNLLSFDYNWDNYDSGLGVLLINDRAGAENMNATQVQLSYSYRIRLDRKWRAQAGLQGGYVFRFFDYSNLTFADQLAKGGATAEPFVGRSDRYPDFSAGLLFYNPTYWFGFSFHHLNRPIRLMTATDKGLLVRFSAQAGSKWLIDKKKKYYLSSSFLFQQQGNFRQLDMSLNLTLSPLLVGIAYRGMPWSETIKGFRNQDALSVVGGIHHHNLRILYSYDLTVSGLSGSGGSHEISLTFAPQYDRRRKKHTKDVECPAY